MTSASGMQATEAGSLSEWLHAAYRVPYATPLPPPPPPLASIDACRDFCASLFRPWKRGLIHLFTGAGALSNGQGQVGVCAIDRRIKEGEGEGEGALDRYQRGMNVHFVPLLPSLGSGRTTTTAAAAKRAAAIIVVVDVVVVVGADFVVFIVLAPQKNGEWRPSRTPTPPLPLAFSLSVAAQHCTSLTLALFLSLIGGSTTYSVLALSHDSPTDRLAELRRGSMEVNKKRRVPLLSPSLPPSSLESLPSPSASCFSMHESWSDPKRNTDTRSSDVIRRRRRISSFLSCSSPPSTPLQSSVTE